MGSAPLPPHERSWRHPSELAASERQALRLAEAPPGTRAFAIVTGTVGLLAVGALMLTVTPRRADSPTALSATSAPIASLQAAASGLVAPSTVRTAGFVAVVRIATAIGDGHRAVMALTDRSDAALLASGSEIDVRLSSGPMVTAIVDSTTAELALLTITTDAPGRAVARSLPAPDELVTVLVEPPITIAFGELATVVASEGTPVLDLDGNLIGLCTIGADGQTAIIDLTDPSAGDAPITATSVASTSVAP